MALVLREVLLCGFSAMSVADMKFHIIDIVGFTTPAVLFILMISCCCIICCRQYRRRRAAYTQPHYQAVTIQPLPPTHQGVNLQLAPAGGTVIKV